jgi:hypothetical protein
MIADARMPSSENGLHDFLNQLIDASAAQGQSPSGLMMTPKRAREFLRRFQPNRYALYSAGWRSGFTVNGIPANG